MPLRRPYSPVERFWPLRDVCNRIFVKTLSTGIIRIHTILQVFEKRIFNIILLLFYGLYLCATHLF